MAILTDQSGRSSPWVVFAADVPLAPPVHGNRVRVAQMVAALRSAGFRVLYLYWERAPREGDVEAMRALVDEMIVVRWARSSLSKRRLRARRALALALSKMRLVSSKAWWRLVEERDFDALCPAVLRTRLAEILAERSCAALVYVYANLAPLAEVARARGVMSVVDTNDVMHLRAESLRERGIKPNGLLVSRRIEAEWLSRADLVLAIQPREAEVLARMVAPERVLLIEHGVRVPEAFDPRPAREERLVILGSNNRPNQDGLAWFLADVWPLVLRDMPTAELWVFGPLSRTSACRGPRVVSQGEVDDVSSAYTAARAVINPVRAGSGLKIKTIEALAWSRALVTTSVGAEGLETAANQAFLTADDGRAFADHCVKCLAHIEFAENLGTAGRALADARFSPVAVYAPLVAAIEAVSRPRMSVMLHQRVNAP